MTTEVLDELEIRDILTDVPEKQCTHVIDVRK